MAAVEVLEAAEADSAAGKIRKFKLKGINYAKR